MEQVDPRSALGQLVERMLDEKGRGDSRDRESSHDVVKAPLSWCGKKGACFSDHQTSWSLGAQPRRFWKVSSLLSP